MRFDVLTMTFVFLLFVIIKNQPNNLHQDSNGICSITKLLTINYVRVSHEQTFDKKKKRINDRQHFRTCTLIFDGAFFSSSFDR